jgi:DNA replication and repair protein RecF
VASIERLRITGLRNLRSVDIRLSEGINWLVGPNGAGKTSVLEAIYLLSRRSSFRGRRFGPLTSSGLGATRIDGWVLEGSDRWRESWCTPRPCGLPDGATRIAVRLIGVAMHSLVEGEPDLRRRFIDWNLFHVEPMFGALRQRYRRVAAQRNAWLRGGGRGHAVWDPEYAELLHRIAKGRAAFFRSIEGRFRDIADELAVFDGVLLEWRSGLPDGLEQTLAWLARHRDADVDRGFSYLTPARSDFRLNRCGTPWIGSRGENKLAAVLLQLAADRVVVERRQRRAVWLVDDFQAELDRPTQARLLPILVAAGDQLIATSVDVAQVEGSNVSPGAMFHVEQGSIVPAPI